MNPKGMRVKFDRNLMILYFNIYIFKASLLMNLLIFATVHSLMKDINLIDSDQAQLPKQYTLNFEFIRQK